MKNGYPKSLRSFAVDRRRMFWDFEIGISRAALQGDPKNANALSMLGNALTRAGKHEEAVDIDRTIVRLMPNEPVGHYNLACSYSNVGAFDEALRELTAAIRLGYRDIDFILRDPDLKNLRKDPRFRALLGDALNKIN